MANILSYLFVYSLLVLGVSAGIGVNYGLLGNNLPQPSSVVSLLQSKGLTNIRIFGPDHNVLRAVKGTGIKVIVGASNWELGKIGTDYAAALGWVRDNIVPYAASVRYIAAGNEMIPGDLAHTVYPAMVTLNRAVKELNLNIKVSTVVSTLVIGASYPPSAGAFDHSITSIMQSITTFLVQNNSPLLLNVYPYFSHITNPRDVSLEYSLFQSGKIMVYDGDKVYWNLFDAILDAGYAALEKMGGSSVKIEVTETGWPSAGNGNVATIENARIFNNNLINHVSRNGTPRRPNYLIEAYIFALFNENQKPAGTEQNWGLFHPNMSPVYPINFHPTMNEQSSLVASE